MIHLILTVGTGTAGPHSNLAAGLRRSLDLLAPDAFWLVPSIDLDSRATADLVREGLPGFQPWSSSEPYRAIAKPDSLEDCRQAVREVIARAKSTPPRNARLLVNPTSGTKQMSAGATLAALDEKIGEIAFIVGERADGVVKTGTESIETFDASAYFAEHDLETARSLGRAGAWSAAATLLDRHGERLTAEADVPRCLHEWERQNYGEARKIAARCPLLAAARSHLEALANAAKAQKPHALIIADLLQTADLFHHRRDFDSALVLACRALEMGLRHALFEETGLFEPYVLSKVCALNIDQGTKERCQQNSNDGKRTILNLHTVAKILDQLGVKLGRQFSQGGQLRDLVAVRNDLMHQLRAVTEAESSGAIQHTRNLLDLPSPAPRPVFP